MEKDQQRNPSVGRYKSLPFHLDLYKVWFNSNRLLSIYSSEFAGISARTEAFAWKSSH